MPLSQIRLRFNRAVGLWEIRRVDRLLRTKQLAIFSKLRSDDAGEEGKGWLCGEVPWRVAGDLESVALGCRVEVTDGIVLTKAMREWRVTFDEVTCMWAIWRADDPFVLVTTRNLELDCEAVTSGGEIRCLAEMLVNGRTNRRAAIVDAGGVRLRTLIKRDQFVRVPLVGSIVAEAKSPGLRG